MIKYQVNYTSEKDLISHLNQCNFQFIPPLEKKVDIPKYAHKIIEKGITFEAWHQDNLVGLVGCYLNDLESRRGFVTNVSTISEYKGRGIATKLIGLCKDYGKKEGFHFLDLKVSKNNFPAIQLYKNLEFYEIDEVGNILFMCCELKK